LQELCDIRNAIDFVRTYRLVHEDIKAIKQQNPDAKITEEDAGFEAKIQRAGNRAACRRSTKHLVRTTLTSWRRKFSGERMQSSG
jgi:hypothetical protein